MVQSTVNTQDDQNQTTSVNRTQPPETLMQQTQSVQAPIQHKSQMQVSGNKEAGSAVITQEASSDENDEDEIKPAPQEIKTQVVSQQAGTAEGEDVELQPATPEVSTASPEVEKYVEKTPETGPVIPEVVKDAGVTLSGPGVITVEQKNPFGITKMPITYAQAVSEEKKTNLRESKHWFLGLIAYVWRKIDSKIGKKGVAV